MRADHIPSQDPRRRFAEGMEREYVLDDLARKPHFVLVDAFPKQHGVRDPSFDLLAFYGEDPRFAKHWRAYRELPRIGTIRVFERDGMKR